MKKKFYALAIILTAALLIFVFRPPEKNGTTNINTQTFPCNQISGAGEKLMCLALMEENEKYCNKMDEPENKNFCLALVTQTITPCKRITNTDAKKNCYYEITLLTNNIEYCDELDDPIHCYFSFVTTQSTATSHS